MNLEGSRRRSSHIGVSEPARRRIEKDRMPGGHGELLPGIHFPICWVEEEVRICRRRAAAERTEVRCRRAVRARRRLARRDRRDRRLAEYGPGRQPLPLPRRQPSKRSSRNREASETWFGGPRCRRALRYRPAIRSSRQSWRRRARAREPSRTFRAGCSGNAESRQSSTEPPPAVISRPPTTFTLWSCRSEMKSNEYPRRWSRSFACSNVVPSAGGLALPKCFSRPSFPRIASDS